MLAACLFVFVPTVSGEFVSADVRHADVSAWRIAQTGAPWLDGLDVSSFNGPETTFTGVAANGHLVSARSPGVVAAAVPAYLVDRWLHGPDRDSIDDFSPLPGNLGAAVLTSIAMALLALSLASRAGPRVAVTGVLLLAFSTPVWTIAADGMWTHTVTILGCAGMVWGCVRERWWLVGVFGGLALWGRLHVVVVVVVLGLGLSITRRQWRPVLHIGAVSGLFLGAAVWWTHWMYGVWSPTGGYRDRVAVSKGMVTSGWVDNLRNEAGLWIAPDRGILVWTPVLVVLAPAVVAAWRARDLPDWSRLLVVGAVAYTLIQGVVNVFHGGDYFYGQRLGLELVVCAAPVVILSWARASRPVRSLAVLVLGGQVAAMFVGASTHRFDLSYESAWRENAFVEALVAMPALRSVVVATVLVAAVVAVRTGVVPASSQT